MSDTTFPRVNLPYVMFGAIVGTIAPAFVAWDITSQVYNEWVRGLPISGGWSILQVFVLDFFCVFVVLALNWKIFCDAKTVIGVEGIERPGLLGPRSIKWRDVIRVEVFGGVGFHIHSAQTKIVLSPYVYTNPETVIDTLRSKISAAKPTTAGL